MTYEQAINYLYESAPLFQNIGAGAYKEGLGNTELLDKHFQHPHRQYATIHVAGTNGKGSVSHTLASILQSQGMKVGLYTSPHLTDFRERIRVNGEMIPQARVVSFVEQERTFFEPLHPSFFELTTALALQYFAEENVDIAVIEVGLGGRMDCTNIIQPLVSIITNISFDHIQFLGNTLEKIASEKAGIIKPGIPAIVGEWGKESVAEVFMNKAEEAGTSLVFADRENEIVDFTLTPGQGYTYHTATFGTIHGELEGLCQEKNTATILEAIKALRRKGIHISNQAVQDGFAKVSIHTGLRGRWQKIADKPLTICDTGHNVGGMQYITRQLATTPHQTLHIVIGMVNDKDVNTVLSMLPQDATYYFTQASVKRAMPSDQFSQEASRHGLKGECYPTVHDAYLAAKAASSEEDLIFIGGSTFIVADLFAAMEQEKR
ncbi:MAG: folylpolyglutamate synthase/dihydrofolate synthase family protein [Bacteroidaceae bacterium]|nr:folylpolyglutamate synthase/dihydrofolate synthase family protein [Bacteroidaceae bacterium]